MRILLLCDRSLSAFDLAVLHHIRGNTSLQIVGVLVNTVEGPSALRRVRREFRKGRGGYVIVQIFRKILNSKVYLTRTAVEYCGENNLPWLPVINLYDDNTLVWMKERNPDVLLLRGFGIIKEPVLSLTPFGVLSYHHGDVRKYRGGPPAFWELYNGEKEMGVTIQILDAGLDTGTIVVQQFIPIQKSDSWGALRKRAYSESEGLAAAALLKLTETGPIRSPEGTKGKLYTLPNLRQWLYLQFKVFVRRYL